MPGIVVPSRRSRDLDDESEPERTAADAATPSSFVSNGSKRARLNDDEESESDGDVLPNSYRSAPRRPRTNGTHNHNGINDASSHGPAQFSPGSIVRVKLTNFVTYTSAEFDLGPSMNMIIGPNGTGKSTLVCAICLGLGWGPIHLGRAKETGEFVKHGAREAEIEIELAAGRGMAKNPIVRRVLKKEGNKNSYYIDGRSVPAKELKEYAQKFNIQIDNLCSFLPQDRVVEFAQLSPVQLLDQTQQAAGSSDMQEWHVELKTLGKEQRERTRNEAQMRETLTQLEARQRASAADVQRVKERDDLQVKMKAWELYRPFIEYRTAKDRYLAADARKKEADKELTQLRRDVEPALLAVHAKEQYANAVQSVVKQRRRVLEGQEKAANEKKMKHDNMIQRITDETVSREAEVNGSRKRKQDIKRIEEAMRRIKVQMDQAPIDFDATAYNVRIREKEQRVRQLNDEHARLAALRMELGNKAAAPKQIITDVAKGLSELNSQEGQQLRKLRNISADTERAWKWVQDHRQEFRAEVFGPPILTCSVPDARYTDAVESMLNMGDMLAFTCTTQDDYEKLISSLCGRNGLRLSDVNIRFAKRAFGEWQKPLPDHELGRLSLDGWLIDQIKGPEPVLSMLCDNRGVHKVAVSLQGHDTAQYEAIARSPITSWVADRQSYNITRRREYGDAGVSTSTRQLKIARAFTSQGVDVEAERQLRQQDADARRTLDELKDQNEELKSQLKNVAEESQTVKADQKELQDEKDEKQKAVADYHALPNKYEMQKQKLDGLQEQDGTAREKIEGYSKIIDKLVLDKGQAAIEYVRAVELLRNLHANALEAELWLIEAASEHEALLEESSTVQQLLREREAEVKELLKTSKQAKDLAVKLKNKALEINGNLSDGERDVHEEIQTEDVVRKEQGKPPYSTEDLEADIQSARNQLELLADGDPNLMRNWEKRAKQIEDLQKKLENLAADMQEQTDRIRELRGRWEPELDALVEKISEAFSYNFSKIGCAGQVEVFKDEEDYEAWSIRILVKFRENEPLSILNSHRQSGGERAVSTIFYLMAMQSLSRAPFRVVDEINQGMDPRNERMVHERLVDIACEEGTSQYFLITPKLLSGLKYHERMKVHIIQSGEYVPENYRELDIGRVLELARSLKVAA